MNYYDRKKELVELAYWSDDVAYEIDECSIHYDPATKQFSILFASGCSCWDSDTDWDELVFNTMEEVEQNLLVDGNSMYHPPLKLGEELLRIAKENWSNYSKYKDTNKNAYRMDG